MFFRAFLSPLRCLVPAIALLASQPAAALAPIPPLDARMEAVKLALWAPAPTPDHSDALTILTRAGAGVAELLSFSVSVNGASLPARAVGQGKPDRANEALRALEWWLVPLDAAGPLTLTYTIRPADPEEPNYSGSLLLPAPDPASRYELVLGHSLLGGGGAQLIEWRTGPEENGFMALLGDLVAPLVPDGDISQRLFQPGGEDDPAMQYAAFQCAQGTPLAGLRVLRGQQLAYERLDPGYYLGLADCALAAGLHGRAQNLLAQWGSLEGRDPWRGAALRLDLAAADYRRGALARAEAALDSMAATVPDPLRARWRGLLARVYFATGRVAAATELLGDFDPNLNQNWTRPGAHGQRLAFMRYNLAVGAIETGHAAVGRTLLDLLGTALPEPAAGLRHQANLTLGWEFLKKGQGASAKRVLSRLPLDSEVANRAILGYGWAMVADPGEATPRAVALPGDERYLAMSILRRQELYRAGKLACQDYHRLFATLPLSPCPTGKTWAGLLFAQDLLDPEAKPLERALAVWQELLTRDPRDPAVIEGSLAAALALAELGDRAGAQASLRRLVERLEAVLDAFARAQSSVSDGRLLQQLLALPPPGEAPQVGWGWAPPDIPDSAAGYFLTDWLARHRSVALLQLVRDARLVSAQIAGQRPLVLEVRPPTGAEARRLDAALDEIAAAAGAMFRAEATQALTRRAAMFRQYYRSALSALSNLMGVGTVYTPLPTDP